MAMFDTRRKRKTLLAVAAAVVTLGAAWAVYEETMRPGPLEAMIPESAMVFGSGDVRWVWNATEDLRNAPEVRAGMAEMERELGISMEKDVVPWAGQVAGAVLSLDSRQPRSAFFIEVRNPVQYYLTMTRLRTRMEREASRYWKGTGYNGVPLRYSYIGQGKGRMPVSTAWLKGWLVVGVGNGTTKRIIDTWQDHKPSLADNTVWVNALAQAPEHPVMRMGVNSGMIAQAAPGLPTGMPSDVLELNRTVTVMGMTDLNDGFRTVSSSVPTAPASRRLYQRLSALPAVHEDTMDRLPDGTFFSLSITDPGAWWNTYKAMFDTVLAANPDATPETRRFVDAAMKRYDPLLNIVRRCEQGLSIGLTYQPQSGFGLAVVGNCGTMEMAQRSAGELRDFVEKFDQEVTVSDDGFTYNLPPAQRNAPIPWQPAWTVNGPYLVLGSHEVWLTAGTGAERIPMSDEAAGAQMYARGDFRFIEPALTHFAPQPASENGPTKEDMIQGWRRTGLDEARWWSSSEIHADGTARNVAEIRDWNWRAAMRALVERQRARSAEASVR